MQLSSTSSAMQRGQQGIGSDASKDLHASMTQWRSAGLDTEMDPLDDQPEKLIDEELVFKAAMSSNYSKITDLSILREEITRLDGNNLTIK